MNVNGVLVRRADTSDASTLAAIHIAARADAFPYLRALHTPEETERWMRDVVLQSSEAWVAESGGCCAGYLVLASDLLDQLYVSPRAQGAGVGTLLLDVAKKERPRLYLHVFQRNSRARRLYEREGFQLVGLRDGSANEEGEPDAVYLWRGPYPFDDPRS